MEQEKIAKLVIEIIDFLSISQRLGVSVPEIKKELEMTSTISPYEFNHIGYGILEKSPSSHEKILVAREYNELITPYLKKNKK